MPCVLVANGWTGFDRGHDSVGHDGTEEPWHEERVVDRPWSIRSRTRYGPTRAFALGVESANFHGSSKHRGQRVLKFAAHYLRNHEAVPRNPGARATCTRKAYERFGRPHETTTA